MTKKYSMRHLLCIALFLLHCTCGCFGAVVQQLPQKGKSALQTYTVSTPEDKSGPEWQPIRFAVYTKFVEDLVNYFEKRDVKGLEVYQNLGEEYARAEEFGEVEDSEEDPEEELAELKELRGDESMTTEKKRILFTEVLPKAIKLHTDRLKVEREKSSPSENVGEYIQTGCYFFKNPLEQKKQDNPDIDFMIFASLSNTYRKVVICTQNKDKRPTSAVIRFIPSEINATRQYIRFTAHEIAHGLGFQHRLMNELYMIKQRESDLHSNELIHNKEYYMVNSTKTVEMLKKHYDCQNDEVKGLYLENENTVKPSHWERRIAKDELMSTYSNSMGATGMYYTELTLGVFHDMPFYSAVFEKAEPMSWAYKSQCEFLKGKKDPKQAKYPNMFCEETDKVALQCTTDRFALGVCLTEKNRDKLPNGYHYFENDILRKEADDWMDGYPIIKPLKGTACEGGNESLLPGSILSNMSRCLNLNKPLKKGENGNGMEVHSICAKVKCDNNNKVSVLKGYDGNEEKWHDCKKDGDEIKLQGSVFNGETVKCPKYEEVCIGLLEAESAKIKFYSDKGVTHAYDVDLNGRKEKDQKEEIHSSERKEVASPAPVKENEPHVEPSAHPKEQQTLKGQEPEKASQSRPETVRVQDSNSNSDVGERADSVANVDARPTSDSQSHSSGSNEEQKSVAQSQRSESVVNGVLTGQSSRAPEAVLSVPSSAISNDNTHGTLKGQEDHLPSTVESSVDSVSGVAGTPAVASQSTVLPAQDVGKEGAKVKPSGESQLNEGQPTRPSEDRLSNAKQVESSSELESQTVEQKETSSEGNKADVHSSNSSTTASQGSTKDVPTVETAQPRKNETTNNTSPSTTSSSTDVQERNNASIAEKEPITEEKKKGSTANQVEDLANQLVTIGEKNADSSITTYIGGCLIALLVCFVGFVMVP